MKNWYTDLDAAPRQPPPGGALFAEDFGRPARPSAPAPEPEIIEPRFSAEEMTEARTKAFNEGHAAGLAAAAAAEAEAAIRTQEAIGAALAQATHTARDLAETHAQAIATLLMDALAAVLPALCARHGAGEIQAVIAAVLPGLIQEPAIDIAVAPNAVPAAQRALARLDPALAPRVRLTDSQTLAAGDVRIAWKDGSARRDGAALCAAVLDILAPSGLLAVRGPIRESVHVE